MQSLEDSVKVFLVTYYVWDTNFGKTDYVTTVKATGKRTASRIFRAAHPYAKDIKIRILTGRI